MKRILYILLVSTLFTRCTEPYIPELKDNTAAKTLIVEGYINADGNSEYTLGYIAPIYQEADSTYARVGNAQMAIEEENGSVYTRFSRTNPSRFTIHHPALNPASRYRLRIIADEREYLSEFVPVVVSPEIKDLYWKINSQEGVRLYLDTESDTLSYFRWEFEETWRFKVPNMSLFLYDGTQVRERTPEEYYPLFCYNTEKSSEIPLYSTEAQEENTISGFNFQFIPNFSEKLGMRYSILLKQYALTKEAFSYWSLVKKNSEEIGDIFGTMPTELVGNLTCISHPDQKIVGLVEAGKIAQKRIFINYNDLPVPWTYKFVYYGRCVITPDQMVLKREADAFFAAHPQFVPVDETAPSNPLAMTHYSYASEACLDCSYRGSVEPPAFWEN